MKRLFFTSICLLTLSVLAENSIKNAVSLADKEVGPCRKDFETLCPGVKPGHGAIKDCLKDKQDKISQECKDKLAQKKEKAKELKEVCAKDVEAFCKEVKKGKGRIIKCLKEHENDASLSAECKSELENIGGKGKEKKHKDHEEKEEEQKE